MAGLTMVAATTASASDGSGGGDGRDDHRGNGYETVDLQLLTFNDFHGYLQPPTGGDATLGAAPRWPRQPPTASTSCPSQPPAGVWRAPSRGGGTRTRGLDHPKITR